MQTIAISIKDEPHWHVKASGETLQFDLETLTEKEACETYLKVKRFMENEYVEHPEYKLAGTLAFKIERGGHVKPFPLLLDTPSSTGVCPTPQP